MFTLRVLIVVKKKSYSCGKKSLIYAHYRDLKLCTTLDTQIPTRLGDTGAKVRISKKSWTKTHIQPICLSRHLAIAEILANTLNKTKKLCRLTPVSIQSLQYYASTVWLVKCSA